MDQVGINDLLERLADSVGVYGSHVDGETKPCRICWTSEVEQEIVSCFRPLDAPFSLRDYFAGLAMQAFIKGLHDAKGIATDAYYMADSMLKVRDEGEVHDRP